MVGAALHTGLLMAYRSGHFSGANKVLLRPFQGHAGLRSANCRAKQGEDELQLVRREGPMSMLGGCDEATLRHFDVMHPNTNDGAILFVFGDEATVAAAQQKEEADKPMQEAAVVPEEPVVEPEAVNSAPSPEEAAAEPEAAYEAVRAEQVLEAAAEEGEQAGPEAGPTEVQEQHAAEKQQQREAAAAVNGGLVPGLDDPEMDPDEALSDEDAPDLQDEIAKTLTSLRVADLKAMCKERNITGYSKYRKSQLVRVLKDAMLVELE